MSSVTCWPAGCAESLSWQPASWALPIRLGVIYERPKGFGSTFFVVVAPFLLNSLLCILLCWPTFIRVRVFHLGDPLSYLVLWVGLSIGTHAFPSSLDAKECCAGAFQAAREFNILALVSLPLVALISLAALIPIVFLGYAYTAVIGLALPETFLRLVQAHLPL